MKAGFVKNYWETRYKNGGNSGLGSYDPVAIEFKASYVNSLIKEYNVNTLIEFGCGDGNQLNLINGYDKYYGYDISETIVAKCADIYSSDTTKIFDSNISNLLSNTYDLSISLDVIYHLVEDSVFVEYMNNLFNSSDIVTMYTTNENNNPDVDHIKHRNIEDYIKHTFPEYKLIDKTDFHKYDVMFLTYIKQK